MQFGSDLLPDRFWDKCIPEPNSGCWLWIGVLTSHGRPAIAKAKGNGNLYAYRAAYEAANGPLPAGHWVTARCSVFCVNPEHLIAFKPAAVNRVKTRDHMKVCSRGHAFTPANTYHRHGGGRMCRACIEVRGQRPMSEEQKQKKRGKDKLYRLWLRFGLTRAMFDAMLAEQGAACAICRVEFTATPQVDHCHATGAVRGLLCLRCNAGIGALNDDPERLRSAIDYLARAKEKQSP